MAPGEAQRVRARQLTPYWCRAALLALSLTRSGAAEAPLGFGLDYRVPERCPDRGWFAQRITSARDTTAEGLEVQVQIERSGDGFRGQLAIYASQGLAEAGATPLRSRQLEGTGCREVLSALAFNLSLYLDELQAEPNATEPPRAGAIAAPPAPALTAPRDDAPMAVPLAASRRWPLEASAALLLRSGLGPGVDLNGRLAIALGPPGSLAAAYEIGFELGRGLSTGQGASNGAEFEWEHRWWGARLSAGPWRYAPLPWLALTPYVAGELGRYQAWLAGRAGGGSSFAWFEPGVRVRAGSWLFARAELAAVLPIAPLRVNIDGREAFRQRPGLSAGLSLGILLSGW